MFGISILNPGPNLTPEQILANKETWVREGDISELAARVMRLASIDPDEFKRGLNDGYKRYANQEDTNIRPGTGPYELGLLLAPAVDLLSDETIERQEEDRE